MKNDKLMVEMSIFVVVEKNVTADDDDDTCMCVVYVFGTLSATIVICSHTLAFTFYTDSF